MSYSAAIDQLNAMVPELHTATGQARRKFSLDELRTLLHALGDPQEKFRSVLVAGTNGKGSTAATLAAILTASGLRTGLYTSPHLSRVNERIRIGGDEIADEDFAAAYFRVHGAAEQLLGEGKLPQAPSYFEILTAQAFVYFAEQKVDVAVLEVGMGGRLDATNVVEPVLSVITDISLDHMEWLGGTIAEIAREKAGILRRGGTMVTLPQHPEANQALGEIAVELGVKGVSAVAYMGADQGQSSGPYMSQALGSSIVVNSPLQGAHQHRNLALAIATAVELAMEHRLPVTAASVEQGIRETCWPGRLEQIKSERQTQGEDMLWVLDVAHNPAGAWALRAGLRDLLREGKRKVLIFSCLRDKPLREMAQILFPLFDRVVLAPIHSARATTAGDLLAAAEATGTPAVVAETVSQALDLARQDCADGTIVVSGSVYLVGEARGLLLGAGGLLHEEGKVRR